MADALTHRGIKVTVASRTESILATVDLSLGRRVEAEMQKHGVTIGNRVEVSSIRQEGEQLMVRGSSDFVATADLVLVAVGVVPNNVLQKKVLLLPANQLFSGTLLRGITLFGRRVAD